MATFLPCPLGKDPLRAGLSHHHERRTAMSTTKSKGRAPAKPPELKIGPFQGGIGVPSGSTRSKPSKARKRFAVSCHMGYVASTERRPSIGRGLESNAT